eukprot:9224213-Pyramimonas_sp.AAC.1
MEADESLERRNKLEDILLKRHKPQATPLVGAGRSLFSGERQCQTRQWGLESHACALLNGNGL